MLSLPVADIIKSVRAIIDESENSELIGDSLVDDMIKDNITRAVLKVHSSADTTLIEGISLPKQVSNEQHPGGISALALPDIATSINVVFKDNVGSISLPADFLRLVSLRMSDWHKACTYVINEDSVEYVMQQDVYSRGTKYNPVCALVRSDSGFNLEVYGSTSSATVSKGIYIPMPTIVGEKISVCTKLKEAVLYQIAGLVMISFSDKRAETLLQISNSLMS